MRRVLQCLSAIILVIFVFAPMTAHAKETVNVSVFPGYVHTVYANGGYVESYKRNAAAARDVLRFSAYLDEPDEIQSLNSDVDFDGKITAKDARILLRYTANLSGFPVILKPGDELRFGPFYNNWTPVALTESSEDLTVELEIIPRANDAPGSSEQYIYHVTPNKPGKYVFDAVYKDYVGEIKREAHFDIICRD